MGVSRTLQRLSVLTEQLEANENEVVELMPQGVDLLTEDGLDVDLTVAIPLIATRDELQDVTLTATDSTVTDGGILSIDLSIHVPKRDAMDGADGGHELDEVAKGDVQSDPKTNGTPDGGFTIDASESVPVDAESVSEKSAEESAVSTEEFSEPDETTEYSTDTETESNCPPYKNPERLQRVYESYNTFAEMTDSLGVDVTPQTVRNHMIEHGIHEPKTNRSSASGSEEDTPFFGENGGECGADELAADDAAEAIAANVELPDDLSLSEITEAVQTAKTLYEVQREIGLGREQTRCILTELDLLELVHGRVLTTSTQSQTKEEIEQRIREAVTNTEMVT